MRNFKTIIDVRDEYEFETGHVENSINLPLSEISMKIDEIKDMPQPIVLCCLSGGRSGVAEQFLQQEGIDCFNAGGWEELKYNIESGDLCWEE